jgi:FkbM family methyltransferase
MPIPEPAEQGILFSDKFRSFIGDDALVYIDGGARGGLKGPWARANDDRLFVLSFDPDPGALIPAGDNHVVHQRALWSHGNGVDIHIAQDASTSSVPPPNHTVLSRFDHAHHESRRTERVISVPSTTLDDALEGRAANFVKLDTHGSEYDALLGASATLSDPRCIGVLIETWTTEVHAGQRLTGDVLCLMSRHGFELFDSDIAAAWHRRNGDQSGKRQLVGLNLLFFRDPKSYRGNPDQRLIVKAAALYQLFGFFEHAREVLSFSLMGNGDKAEFMKLMDAGMTEITPLSY